MHVELCLREASFWPKNGLTIVSCSDFTGFSSDYLKCKVVKPSNRSHDSKSEMNVTMWLISAHAHRVQGYIHCAK